jgi:hypothetical protein
MATTPPQKRTYAERMLDERLAKLARDVAWLKAWKAAHAEHLSKLIAVVPALESDGIPTPPLETKP